MPSVKAKAVAAEPLIDSPGAALRAGRERLQMKPTDVTVATAIPEIYLYNLETDRQTLPGPFLAYTQFLARKLGDEWAAEMADLVFEAMAASARNRGGGVERLRLAERAYRGLLGGLKTKTHARSGPVTTAAEIRAEMAERAPARVSRRPRSSGERATVLDRARLLGFRVLQGAPARKPQSLLGMAAAS